MRPLAILVTAILVGIATLLGSGIYLFDSLEKQSITVDMSSSLGLEVTCGIPDSLMLPLEGLWSKYALVAKASVTPKASQESQAIQSLIDGQVDLALTFRLPTHSEFELASHKGLIIRPLTLGFDDLAIIAANHEEQEEINELSLGQLRDAYFSETPSDTGLRVFALAGDHAANNLLRNLLARDRSDEFSGFVRVCEDFAHMLELVSTTPRAIGFVPSSLVTDHVQELRIVDESGTLVMGALNTRVEIRGGGSAKLPIYLLSLTQHSPDVNRFLDFALGQSGQNALATGNIGSYR
jgi:DNA-binding transcriptional LysR family regulator